MQQKPSKKDCSKLDLQQRKEYRSGAVLYSPCKVREARYCNKVNKNKKLTEEAKKHHCREERATTALCNKLEKERRLKAYKERLKALKVKRAAVAAKKERKKQERNAAKALQLP